MGAWSFIDRRLEEVMISSNCKQTRPIYIGRPEAASPATGSISRHIREQKLLVSKALMLNIKKSMSAAE